MKTRLSIQSSNAADMLRRKAFRAAFRLMWEEETGSVPSLCLSYRQFEELGFQLVLNIQNSACIYSTRFVSQETSETFSRSQK